MRIPWLYTGADGRSHFGELDIPQEERPGVVGASSPDIATEPLRLQTAQPGTLDFHPAPRRQFVIVLSGGIEIELADGEKRQFGPGELFLADDTTGQGHRTRTIGETRNTVQVGVPASVDLTRWRVGEAMTQVTVKLVESPEEYQAVREVRLRVFIEEQGIDPELEYDELDATATHAIAFVDGAPAGTGRMVRDEPGVARIGRMAVDAAWRRHGVGSRLLRLLEREAARQGYHTALLHAQTYVQAFYQVLGYQPAGAPFMEADIEHVTMTRTLRPSP